MHEPVLAESRRHQLGPGVIPIDASPELTCRALLVFAASAQNVLLRSHGGYSVVPGRWQAQRADGDFLVRYELYQGPVHGLTFDFRVDATDSGSALLHVTGSAPAPRRHLFRGRRTRRLAEAMATGLVVRLQNALADMRMLGVEQRATPRSPFQIPARLRLGNQLWYGQTRDVSSAGIGFLLSSESDNALEAVSSITAHQVGAAELLIGESRLLTRVKILRARAHDSQVDIGLRFSNPVDAARFLRRLEKLGLWDGAGSRLGDSLVAPPEPVADRR